MIGILNRRHGRRQHSANSGFTLLEILISVTLSAVVTGAVVNVYLGNKATYRAIDSLSRLQESGRFALNFIVSDLRHSGFQGCLTMADPGSPGALAQYSLNDDTWYDFRLAVTGANGTSSAWSPALNGALTSALTGVPAIAVGTDLISMRQMQRLSTSLSAPMSGATAAIPVANDGGIAQNDIVILSDCTATAVAQITQVAASGTQLQHAANTGTAPQNATASLGKTFAQDAELFRATIKTYYIAPSVDDASQPALWFVTHSRPGASAAPTQLIDGVEDLQITYGVDTDADLSPNRYLDASAVSDWSQVVAVQLELLVRTIADHISQSAHGYVYAGNTVSDPGDRRIRRTFTATVGVRNSLN